MPPAALLVWLLLPAFAVADADKPVSTPPEATRSNAGSDDCRVDEAAPLGRGGSGPIVVGFDRTGGLAAWQQVSGMLAVRPIAPDGSARGPVIPVAVGKEIEPHTMFATERGFVLLLLRWDYQHDDARWWGRVFGRDGRPAAPAVDLGLAGMNLEIGQAIDGDRIGLVVVKADIAKHKQVGRWQTLIVGQDGIITSIPVAAAVDDLATTTDDVWEPAVLAGKRGWVVSRRGVRRPEGIFDGVRRPAAAALRLGAPDGLSAEVVNLAEPPGRNGRMADGKIYEAMGRPALRRTQAGKSFGQLVPLHWRGNAVGTHAMNVDTALFWSGTHFLYPFHDDNDVAYLLPVNCRP